MEEKDEKIGKAILDKLKEEFSERDVVRHILKYSDGFSYKMNLDISIYLLHTKHYDSFYADDVRLDVSDELSFEMYQFLKSNYEEIRTKKEDSVRNKIIKKLKLA